ncbi:MAG TPA: histidine phosphatase family protein [Gemmatimonadaceae bacterium]|nr:histidine phosphatase family protein [Gemmatimonadaceae bacterium]
MRRLLSSRLPFPAVRCLVLAAALLLLSAAGLDAQSTVVVIVRHAEKEAQPANDPPLTATGAERAQALAAALGDAGVDVVMHTPTTRTRETARPVAERFGLTPEVLPLGPMSQHAQAVAAAVRKHAGKTIVVVGHSNTIMSYIEALGGPARGDLCDHQYDGLYTLILDGDSASLIEGHYGPANPKPTQACRGMLP